MRSIPTYEYIYDTPERIPVVTRRLLRKYHTKDEVLRFTYFAFGHRIIRLDNGEQCFEASLYERWLHDTQTQMQNCS